MHGRKDPEVRRMFMVLALLVAALTLVAAGCGGDDDDEATPAATTGQTTAEKGEFGEVYEADPAILEKAMFNAELLPEDETARNIALAAYGRADDEVDQTLALKCWKNNGCDTGTGGEMSVAYVEGFGENVYREISKMEFILQALTYPDVGKITYTSAQSDPAQALTDFRAAISQGVDLIVTYPDFGDAMLPVFKEATEAGIPVATYAWGFVTGPGENYLTVVGEDTCALGKVYAEVMNREVGSGKIAFLGGFPGNPLSLGWQKCEEPALNPEIEVVANEATNWDSSKVQEVVAGILARHPDIKGWSYEYGLGMAQGAFAAYKAAGLPFDAVLTLRTDDVGLGCAVNELKNPNLKAYYYTAGNSQIRVAFTAAMMKLKGAEIPPQIVFPIELQNQTERDSCVDGYPQEASATSLVPVELLGEMYPG